jgi:phosphotriesterase-related protein
MPIHTVLGPIDPSRLGPTSMHEHCLLDASVWASPPREAPPVDPRVTIENLGFLRWNYDSLADNLRLEDPELTARELSALGPTPDAAIVDLTVIGLGRRIAELPAISRTAGVHIIVGCGFYVDAAHPDWVESCSVDQLAELIVGELRDGIDGTGIRPGLIGEIGTSNPPTDRERRIVRAAGAAAAQTGTAVNLHIDPFGRHAVAMIELLLDEDVPADRIVVSHLDSYLALDHGYHRAVADSGAILEYDNFGMEAFTSQHHDRLIRNNTDLQRLEALGRLIEEGFAGQIVLGNDVYTKAQLRTFGGCGYDHVIKRIAPALQRYFGVSDDTTQQILIETPRRLLDRPSLP